ncbi:MAG: hypothetical protein OIF38_12015 [Cellvibrionaceae bacterium]|nr:hypothetical protein [Cellvibrionaceae bacterium]
MIFARSVLLSLLVLLLLWGYLRYRRFANEKSQAVECDEVQLSDRFEDYKVAQLLQATQLWTRLTKRTVNDELELAFCFCFVTRSRSSVQALSSALPEYKLKVHSKGIFKKIYWLSGTSAVQKWSREALLQWVAQLIKVGRESQCILDYIADDS